jgi:outer membrane lipoprotein SlyB
MIESVLVLGSAAAVAGSVLSLVRRFLARGQKVELTIERANGNLTIADIHKLDQEQAADIVKALREQEIPVAESRRNSDISKS